jgi:hypothetical protein
MGIYEVLKITIEQIGYEYLRMIKAKFGNFLTSYKSMTLENNHNDRFSVGNLIGRAVYNRVVSCSQRVVLLLDRTMGDCRLERERTTKGTWA